MENITGWKCRANKHIIINLDSAFHLGHEAFNAETMLILKLLEQRKQFTAPSPVNCVSLQ